MQPLVPFAKGRRGGMAPVFSRSMLQRLYAVVILMLFFGSVGSYAQTASQYGFSTGNTASLALDRNSNTVNMGTGTTQLIGSSVDDQASSVTNIGFTFRFNGTDYTQFTASSNGGIRLGGSAISSTYIGTSFPSSNQAILAPYLQDIETHSSGKVHYKLVGTSPNRALVIEFLSMRINFTSTTNNATFQARLYEGTNIIEYVYGAMAVGSTSNGGGSNSDARNAIIGFCHTNTTNNLISVNQGTYATSLNSSPIVNVNSSTGNIAGLNSSVDGSRRSFTFTPPTVTAGTISGSPFCAGVAVTVPFTSVGTFTSNTYTAQLSNASGSFSSPVNIGTLVSNANSGNISATIPGGTAAGTGYRIRVTSSNSNVLSVNNGVNLTVSASPTVSGPTSVCVGATTNVTPSSGGTWTSGDNGIATVDNAGLVTGVSAGSTTLTFTDGGTGCSNTVAVTVNGDATLTFTSGVGTDAQTVCQGSSIVNITYLVGGSGTGASASGLPSGVTGTYNGGTKVLTISGAPTAFGSFNYTVTTTGPCGNTSLNGTIDVTEASSLTLSSGIGTNIQTVCINNSINAIFYTIGGTATGATLSAGVLPNGVTGAYDGDLGEFSITGIPTEAGTFNYTVTSTGPCPVSLTGTITVNDNSTLSLFSGSDNQTVCISTAISNIVYQVGGGGTGGTVTGLPTGVTGTYNGGTKRVTIAGTPSVSGTFNYTVTTTGPCVNTSLNGTIVVNANSTISLTSGNNSQTICENTAIADITYSLGGGATGASVSGLPAGLSGTFDGGVYTISGTATASGTFNYTVTATGPCVNPSLNGTIRVNPAPVVALSATPGSVCFTHSATLNVTNSGGTTTPTYSGTGAGVGIPNWSASSYAYSSVTLAAGSETLSASDLVQVTLNIAHNNVEDLDIFLVDPSGTRAMLLSSDNGGTGNNYTNTVLSTAASNVIGSTGNNSAPFTATYRPEGTITTVPDRNGNFIGGNYNSVVPGNALNGAAITGTWTLRVFDDGFGTTGSLTNWTLSITKAAQPYTTIFSGPATITPDAPTGLNTNPSAIVNAAVGANSYTATTTDALGCSTTSDPAIVTVNPVPDAPISGGDQTVCEDGNPTQTLTATATGGTITWYDAASNGNLVGSPVQVGVGSSTYYAEASDGTCSSLTRTAVTLTILAAPVASGSNQTVCEDGNPLQTLTATATGGTITWFDAATAGNVVPSPVQTGVGTATYYAESNDGSCPSVTRTAVTLTINETPATPGAITGPLDACPLVNTNTVVTYSIDPVVGATSYNWTVPVGVTIVSGQGTTSLNVTFDNTFALTNSFFIVTATNGVGCTSAPSSLEVLKNVPGIPTVINGPTDACPFAGQPTNATYSIAPVANATSYTWTVSGNATLVSGQGTTSIQVSFAANYTAGNIRVTANSNCGNRSPRQLSVTRLLPTAPVAITGPTDACPFIGTNTQVTYSIAPVANAVSYTWTVPANVTLVSGQGTTSINVIYNNGYVSSNIKVKSVSNCFTSGDRQLLVTGATYSGPGAISGPTNACAFIGTANDATYTIRKVTNAPSYIWTVPTGATITGHPGGAGVNDTIITVSFDNSFVSGSQILVQTAGCVTSTARSITINRILPSTPGLISGPTNVCEFMDSPSNPGGSTVTYTIRKVANATSYTWTAPANATITAHPGGAGVNDTIVEVKFNSSFTTGAFNVTSSNACGESGIRVLNVTRLSPGTPSFIDVIQTSACPSRVYTYTIAFMPTNTTSVQWTIPAAGTLISGQGSTSITVSYPSIAISGQVTATAVNNCDVSVTRFVNIKLAPCFGGREATVNTMADKQQGSETVLSNELRLNVYPNPSAAAFKVEILSADKTQATARILDLQGREIKRLNVQPGRTIELGADLRRGNYILEITQGEKKTTQKIIKL